MKSRTNNTFETCAYDPRDPLTNVGGITYGYDPANNRAFLTNGGIVSDLVTEPQSSEVLMRITGDVTNYYIYGPGLLYEIDATATTASLAFYHFDSRGSTAVLTDGNGNPTDGIEYSPYGTTTYRFGTNTTPFLFNGQFGVQTDPNGLLYMRARYYNPYICRFINADPSGFGGGLNFYLFCNDNPVSETDPFGLGPGYGNPVSGPNGPVGPSDPFAPGMPYYGNGAFYVPGTMPPPTLMQSLAGGIIIGAGVATAVVVAAPEAVTVLTGVGLSATAAQATVTTGLAVSAGIGAYATDVNTAQSAGTASVTGNWNGVAYNVGTLIGGGAVGIFGGGDSLSTSISGNPSQALPGIFGDRALGYDPNFLNGSVQGWLGEGPSPQSGAGLLPPTASGAGLFLQPSSQSSPTGK